MKKNMFKIKKSKIIVVVAFLLVLLSLTIPNVRNGISSFLVEVGLIEDTGGETYFPEGAMEVHYIDVGQADSVLIISPQGNMLIDAGSGSSLPQLKAYLQNKGVSSFEYVIFTHPHEDHIGGAAMIMSDFDVKNVIIPNCVQTTKVYENMITAIEQSNAVVLAPVAGDVYNIGNMKFKILAPNNPEYSSINNYSIVLRIEYGENSLLMSGDAEQLSEKEMLEKFNLSEFSSDILKLGHHGSNTSTSKEFLAAVSPTIAIVSCGKDNRYGHPDRDIIDRINAANITYYRTDIDGSIVLVCNGKTIVKK